MAKNLQQRLWDRVIFLNGIPNAGDGSYELKYPDGVCIAGGKLFITDLQNNRVLIYDSIPSSSTAKASWVVASLLFGRVSHIIMVTW